MEVTIQETTTVCPSNLPFNHDHVLSLSYLDTDPNIDLTFRYFRVYANQDPDHHLPFSIITTALAKALVPYYHFVGHLRRKKDNKRLELHCEPGQGVPVVKAIVDLPLASVDHLDNPDKVVSELLVPDPNSDEAMAHPMILQVTMFSCGGYVLGSALHNALCDGIGATQFFNLMAELARGGTQSTTEPVWERLSLLGPRDPPRVEFPFHEVLSVDKDFSISKSVTGPVVRECFDMKEEWLDALKSWLFERSDSRFTTFEALGAFIWRARVKASKVPKEEKVKFSYLMNIRKLVNPPLPRGYWGNGCAHMYVQLTAGELVEQPLWETAELIKKSKFNANNEYVRSYIDFQKLNYGKGINAGKEVSGFTDWRHLGHSTVDFGSGGPVTVFPVVKHFLGSIEPCFFLPYSCAVKGEKPDGFKVLVNLRESAMDEFKVEMDKFSRLDYGLY